MYDPRYTGQEVAPPGTQPMIVYVPVSPQSQQPQAGQAQPMYPVVQSQAGQTQPMYSLVHMQPQPFTGYAPAPHRGGMGVVQMVVATVLLFLIMVMAILLAGRLVPDSFLGLFGQAIEYRVFHRGAASEDSDSSVAPSSGLASGGKQSVSRRTENADSMIARFSNTERATWAIDFLGLLGNESPSIETVAFVVAWQNGENTEAAFNPLATTYVMPGNTCFNKLPSMPCGVKNFKSREDGLTANVTTLKNGFYPTILSDLVNNTPMKGDHAVLTKEMETWGTGLGLVEQQYQLVLAEIGGTPAADTPAASGDTIVVSSDGFAFQGNTLEVKFTVKNVSGELVSLSKSAIQFSVKTKGDVRQFSFPKTADIAPGISQAFIVEVHDASGNGVGEADVEEVVVDVTMNGQRYSTRLERQE